MLRIRCLLNNKVVITRNNYRYSSSTKDEKTRALLDQIIRVDHAGEFGAVQIYLGQLAVLKNTPKADIIKEMLEQEKVHLSAMEGQINAVRARPTILLPFWKITGFLLGVGTAALGDKAAMACTVAVETAIGEHYDSQLRELLADGKDGLSKHKELIEMIGKFRDEELEHLETGLANEAEKAPLYESMSYVIKKCCVGAIWLSQKI